MAGETSAIHSGVYKACGPGRLSSSPVGCIHRCKAQLQVVHVAGGWLQVAVKHMPMSSLIVGVDLVPIRPIRGAKTIIGDITSAQCRQVRGNASDTDTTKVLPILNLAGMPCCWKHAAHQLPGTSASHISGVSSNRADIVKSL